MDIRLNPEVGSYIAGTVVNRFIPEPKTSLSFRKVLGTIGSFAGILGGGLGGQGNFPGLDPGYAELISMQIEVQQQMQLTSLYSNIEKSKHETQMAAVRNIRVG